MSHWVARMSGSKECFYRLHEVSSDVREGRLSSVYNDTRHLDTDEDTDVDGCVGVDGKRKKGKEDLNVNVNGLVKEQAMLSGQFVCAKLIEILIW